MILMLYVDDFHLAGEKTNAETIWEKFKSQGLVIEEPNSFGGNTFLGVQQFDVGNNLGYIRNQLQFLAEVDRTGMHDNSQAEEQEKVTKNSKQKEN